jgi:ribosomal protein S18 acetylase RimI-like enzyme
MKITKATPSDVDVAMAIVESCIDHMQSQGIDQWDSLYPDRAVLERDITNGNLYLAVDGDICRGIVTLNEEQSKEYEAVSWRYYEGKILVVHRLAIDPSSQGQGVASRMMDFAEEYAYRQGYSTIRLDAFLQNPSAVRLYTRRHYRVAGTVEFRKGTFHCFEKNLVR